MNSFSASITPGERVVPEDKTSTGFTIIMVEEMTEALVGERRGTAGDREGVFIETSTPATMEVGMVTISGRTGSTTSVGDAGW